METEKETKIHAAGKACGYVMGTGASFAALLMWLCLGAIVIMCFYPPWREFYRDGNVKITEPKGYHFIFEPPRIYSSSLSQYYQNSSSSSALSRLYPSRRPKGVSIDFERLGLQCVPLLGISVVMYLIQVNDKKKQKK